MEKTNLLKLDKHKTHFTWIPTRIHPTSSLTTYGENKRKLWSIVDMMLRYGEKIFHAKNIRKLCLTVNVPKIQRYNVQYVTHFKHSDFLYFSWYHSQIWNLQTIAKWKHWRCNALQTFCIVRKMKCHKLDYDENVCL